MKEDFEFLLQILDDLNTMRQEVIDGTRTQFKYENSLRFWKSNIQNAVNNILQE